MKRVTIATGILVAVCVAALATLAVWSSIADAPWEGDGERPSPSQALDEPQLTAAEVVAALESWVVGQAASSQKGRARILLRECRASYAGQGTWEVVCGFGTFTFYERTLVAEPAEAGAEIMLISLGREREP